MIHGKRFKNWHKPAKLAGIVPPRHFAEPVIESGRDWVTYKYMQSQFKELLGIDDPHNVLAVEIDIFSRQITVRMMH